MAFWFASTFLTFDGYRKKVIMGLADATYGHSWYKVHHVAIDQ
jgi:hypothetical protein